MEAGIEFQSLEDFGLLVPIVFNKSLKSENSSSMSLGGNFNGD